MSTKSYEHAKALQSPCSSATSIYKETFFKHLSTCIKHMLLLSYADERVDLSPFNSNEVLVKEEKRSVREIRKHEVRYRSLLLGLSNILSNSKLGRIQVVGFNRSELANKRLDSSGSGKLRKRSLGEGGSREKRIHGV